jgi:hypothetical protein
VWGIMKEIHWNQERKISWSCWCSLHDFLREMQDRQLYHTVLWHVQQLYHFFQNPVLNHKSSPHLIFLALQNCKKGVD